MFFLYLFAYFRSNGRNAEVIFSGAVKFTPFRKSRWNKLSHSFFFCFWFFSHYVTIVEFHCSIGYPSTGACGGETPALFTTASKPSSPTCTLTFESASWMWLSFWTSRMSGWSLLFQDEQHYFIMRKKMLYPLYIFPSEERASASSIFRTLAKTVWLDKTYCLMMRLREEHLSSYPERTKCSAVSLPIPSR